MLAIAISPGNGAVLSMRYGLTGELSYATPVIIGLQLGLLGVYLIVLLSLMLTTHISPHVIDVIACLGGLYLIYLGSRDVLQAVKRQDDSALAEQLKGSISHMTPESVTKRVSIGTLTNLTNPKGILFMAAFYPQWLQVNAAWSLTKQAIAMGCVAVVIDTMVMHFYALLASTIKRLLKHPKAIHILHATLGAFLCLVGITMLLMRFWK